MFFDKNKRKYTINKSWQGWVIGQSETARKDLTFLGFGPLKSKISKNPNNSYLAFKNIKITQIGCKIIHLYGICAKKCVMPKNL